MADAAPIYVDNGSAATSRTGSWCATTGTYGATSAYSCGSGLDTYRLVPQVPVSGKYNVYIRYRTGSSRSTKAPFIVKHASGTTKLEFNQTLTGDQWVLHGLYSFAAGTTGYIETSDVNGSVSVDGIQLVPSSDFVPGQTYRGRASYVTYIPGNLPIILSAPHDGSVKPTEIPDRIKDASKDIVTVRDVGSRSLMNYTIAEIYRLTGKKPHVIYVNLARVKMDANRDLATGANGNWYAGIAWSEFHNFLEIAKHNVYRAHGKGHYFDFHSHSHTRNWIELGYGISRTELELTDLELNATQYTTKSSINKLVSSTGRTLSSLLRGTYSFGGYIDREGSFDVVPSPTYPSPGLYGYFNGGYDTHRHGSSIDPRFVKVPNVINAVQIEAPVRTIVYGGTEQCDLMGRTIGRAIRKYVNENYDFNL